MNNDFIKIKINLDVARCKNVLFQKEDRMYTNIQSLLVFKKEDFVCLLKKESIL